MKITKNSKKKMVKIFIFFIAFSSFASILIYAFSNNMVYFYTPTQIEKKEAPLNSYIRIGGMVKKDSILRSSDSLKITFVIHDLEKEVSVIYDGILPDLFAENQGVVMTGKINNDNVFIADEVLAKHDENYMPPEVADMMKNDNQAPYKK
jgi:cytochrome c-type biogenesis protein CcmE